MKKQLILLIFLMGIMTFGMEIEERKYNIQDKYTTITGNIPVFKSEEKIISDSTVDIFEFFIDLIVMESRRFFVEEGKSSPNNFVLKSDYYLKKNEMGVDSYLVKTYYYMGGEHGMMVETPYNFKDGAEVSLGDFFKEDVNYTILIKNKIEEIIIEEDPSIYYENVSIKENGYKYYFSEDKLVIIFDVYEIGPYESGIPAFEIPISELKDYLK